MCEGGVYLGICLNIDDFLERLIKTETYIKCHCVQPFIRILNNQNPNTPKSVSITISTTS